MPFLDRLKVFLLPREPDVSEEQRTFVESLATKDVWVLAVALRGVPAVPRALGGDAYRTLAEHRVDVAEMTDDDSVFPFNYRDDKGYQILPFFSTEDGLRVFLQTGARGVDPSTFQAVFQPCRLLAGFVASPENDDFILLLDAASPDERRLTQGERMLLRRLSSPA